MTRLVAAEFRKLFTIRLWLWMLLVSVAWTIAYTALAIAVNGRSGQLGPSLSSAAGQHALFSIGAGGAGTLVAVMAMAQVAGEYRHRTASATFLAMPRRSRIVTAQVITYLLVGLGYALACVVISLAVVLPWLAARGIHASAFGNGNLAVLAAVVIAAGLFGVAGAGLGAALHNQLAAVAAMLLYLYVLEPLVSHIASLASWTPYLPGVAADGLTQAAQNGVRLLSPWAGGLVFAAWAAAFAIAGTVATARTDIAAAGALRGPGSPRPGDEAVSQLAGQTTKGARVKVPPQSPPPVRTHLDLPNGPGVTAPWSSGLRACAGTPARAERALGRRHGWLLSAGVL